MDDAAKPVPRIPADPAQDLADISTVEYGLVYEAEKPGLIRFLLHFGVSYPTAEDLAQGALEELHRQWGKVDKPGPWLRKVAVRKLGRSRVTGECSLGSHDQPSTTPGPAAAIESLWEEDAVLSAIRQLPLKEKQVFALHFDKFETREIADMLQMTPDAVRQNLARARARLKKLLGFEGASK
jgi:RNA polymerase sigma-70 factor (ECF subfamily)